MLRKVKQLLSNFEAERWENLSNLRLAKKSVAYKKNSSVLKSEGEAKVKVLPAAAVPFEPLWWIVPAKPVIVLPRSPLWRVGHAVWLAGASLAAAAGNRPWGHSSHPHRRPQKRLRTRCTNSPPHCPEERKPHKILQSHLWHTNFNLI